MSKRIILVILALIASALLLRPHYMWKNDVVDAMDFGATEVKTEISAADKANIETVATSYKPVYTYKATYNYSSDNTGYGSVAYNSISILGKNIAVQDVGDTSVNAGNHVNKYGARFYYGHNSGAVFGGLPNLGVGSTFTITYGGVVRTYRVAKTMIFEKNVSNSRLQLNGEGNYMKSVAGAVSGGVQYDVSLMTCYGTSYGNGDASHRFVIFANAI